MIYDELVSHIISPQLFLQCIQVIARPRGQRRQKSTMIKVWHFAAFKICTFSLSALVEAAWAASMSPCSPNSTDCLSDSLTWFSSSVSFVCTYEITWRNATSLPADSCPKAAPLLSGICTDSYEPYKDYRSNLQCNVSTSMPKSAGAIMAEVAVLSRRGLLWNLVITWSASIRGASVVWFMRSSFRLTLALQIEFEASICLLRHSAWVVYTCCHFKGGKQEATKGSLHFQQA